jgi:hypothetical protein
MSEDKALMQKLEAGEVSKKDIKRIKQLTQRTLAETLEHYGETLDNLTQISAEVDRDFKCNIPPKPDFDPLRHWMEIKANGKLLRKLLFAVKKYQLKDNVVSAEMISLVEKLEQSARNTNGSIIGVDGNFVDVPDVERYVHQTKSEHKVLIYRIDEGKIKVIRSSKQTKVGLCRYSRITSIIEPHSNGFYVQAHEPAFEERLMSIIDFHSQIQDRVNATLTKVAAHLEKIECCICLTSTYNMCILVPCGHRCVCSRCSVNIQQCPLCRASCTAKTRSEVPADHPVF